MSTSLKPIDIYLDAGNSRVVDSNNNAALLGEIAVPFGSTVLFRARVQNADGTAVAIPTGTVFVFAIDNSYSSSHADLVSSSGADFMGAGDWDEADLAAGLVCWRANLNTNDLKTALGTEASKEMVAELWMQAPGEDYSLLAQWTVTVKNIVANVLQTPTTPGVTYATTAAVTQVAVPTNGAYRLQDGMLQLYNTTTGQWHPLYVTGGAGAEQLAIGPGVA